MMHLLLISTTRDKMITAFSWMLIHSLWQGMLLAIIAGALLMATKRSGAAYRYNLALVLFLAFTGICAFTLIWEWNNAASQTTAPALTSMIGAGGPAMFFGNLHDLKQPIAEFTGWFSAHAPLVVLTWFIFFLFKSVKMIACLVYNERIRTREVYEPAEFWTSMVARLSEKLKIKRTVKLLQSGYIKMPVVIGHLKPVILVPVSCLAGFPADQVEAILLHELAHIRRSDYFVNFFQNIAETVFFFNPGLLWISSLLREERENCCDDIALKQTKNKRGFVQALISFKEHELYGLDYATAFAGKKNYLLLRVSRILDYKNKSFGIGERIFFTMSVLILSVILTAAMIMQIKEHTETGFKYSNYSSTHTVLPNPSTMHKTEIRKVKATMKYMPVQNILAEQKIVVGVAGIKEHKQPVAAIGSIIQPVHPVAPINNRQAALTDNEQADPDQIQPREDQEHL